MLVGEFYADRHLALRFGIQDDLHIHHSGQDVNDWPIRTPIPSFVRGVVVSRGSDPANLGNWVTVRAYEGGTSKLRPERVSWCHLDSLDGVPPMGRVVGFGGYVGPLGTSGYSTGPHTHIMVSLTSDDPRSYAGLIDPLPYIVAARTSTAATSTTPFDEGDIDMRAIREPGGGIALVGETTYQYLDLAQWTVESKIWGSYTQLTKAEFDKAIADTQVRRAYLLAGISGGGATVDPDAIAKKVEAQIADDLARLSDQIKTINTELGAPTPAEIADELAERLKG